MHYTHQNTGTCSRQVEFDIDETGKISNICFTGGCNGNLKGIAALCEGQDAENIAKRIAGIKCGYKNTSCPDQLSKAIREVLERK